jgi:hypothetical protein
MGWVPRVSRAAGVDRRDRWELQLYGIEGISIMLLLVVSDVERFFEKIPESVVQMNEQLHTRVSGKMMARSWLQVAARSWRSE